MSGKSILSKIFTILLFIIIIYIGYHQKDALIALLKDAKLNWIFTGLMFYFCNYVTRAHRLQLLAGKQHIPFRVALKVSSLHGFYSYFLPLRSGDISLPLLLNRFTSLQLLPGASILFRARLLDMFSLGVLLTCSTLLSYDILDGKIYSLFLLASAILLCAPFLIKKAVNTNISSRMKWLNSFTKGVSKHPLTPRQATFSILIWFWTGCTLFSATRALAIPIQFMDIWFLVAIQLPIQLFPVQGIANAGNHELGWVTGFTLLGISPEKGLEFALASHAIIIVYVLILGAIGLFMPGRSNSYSSTRE